MKNRATTLFAVASLLMATIGTGQSRDGATLAAKAENLSRTTARLDRSAEIARHYKDAQEDRAVLDVFYLDSAARWLVRQVGVYGEDKERTRSAFDEVLARHEASRRSIGELRSDRDLRLDSEAVDEAVGVLSRTYGVTPNRVGTARSQDPEMRPVARRELEPEAPIRREPTVEPPIRRESEERRVDPRMGDNRGRPVSVPSGTVVGATLEHAVLSRDYRAGDRLNVNIAEDVMVDGHVLIPARTRAILQVTEMAEAGRIQGKESISFELREIELGGKMVPIDSNVVSYVADGTKEKDAKVIGGSAVVGTIIGLLKDGGSGGVKGAVIGAAAGTGVVLATKGETVKLPVGERIEFSLDAPIDVLPPATDDARGATRR